MKICTVIVTYNRKELLRRCIDNCLSQTCNNTILVFDNCSCDGTEDYLKTNGYLGNQKIIYYKSDENLGGAGGFCNGLKKAYELGFDGYWLMDDDGYPLRNDTLMRIIDVLERYNNKKVIINSMVVSSDSILSFATGGFECKNQLIEASDSVEYVGAVSPFNGTFITREVVEIIGFPRADFFIKGDETEYMCRAKKNGIIVSTAVKSEFYHPKMPSVKKRVLWFTFDGGEESYWKEYYKARNYVYIYKTYYGRFQLFKHYVYCKLKSISFKDDVKRKRKYVKMGLKDGKKNVFKNIKIEK